MEVVHRRKPMRAYLDERENLKNGTSVIPEDQPWEYPVKPDGTVTTVHLSRQGNASTHEIAILYLTNINEEVPFFLRSVKKGMNSCRNDV